MEKKIYKRLDVGVELPEYIEDDIQLLLDYLNAGNNILLSDVYRSNLRLDINSSEGYDFDSDVAEMLRNYYVRGGIFDEAD